MLPFTDDLLSEVTGPDAACVAPMGSVTLPVGTDAGTVVIDWTDRGPVGQGGLAARVRLRFADGRTLERNAMLGEHVGRPPAPSRTTLPVTLGHATDGSFVAGARWRIVTGRPDVTLTDIVIDARMPGHPLCVTNVATEPGPAPVRIEDGYAFQVPATLGTPLPQAVVPESPAGAHGKVRLQDGHLVFADGTRARFFGVNLFHRYAIPQKADADALAATLANLGFNMVRLHHMELPEVGLVNPKRGQTGKDGTVEPALSPEVVDRLDYFLARLKAHGVYLYLEGSTFRTYTAADGVRDPHPAIPNGHKPLPYFEEDWRTAQLTWFDTLWGRTNPYTGTRYADDPIVAVVELTNEHSLLSNWAAGLELLPTAHVARLDAAWNDWLRGRYTDDAALNAAWVGNARPGLQPGESLATGTVRRDPTGLAFGSAFPEQRRADLYTFYAGLERAYVEQFTAHVRALGFDQPVVPTLPYARPDVQYAHRDAEVSDLHLEWDVPARREAFRGESLLAAPRGQAMLDLVALSSRAGAAMTVSELNHAMPNAFMAEAPLFWATLASLQDWDALVWNSFPLTPTEPGDGWTYDDFDGRVTTVKLAQMPTASSLFRGGWVSEAKGWLPLHYTADTARLSATHGRLPLPTEVGNIDTWLRARVETSVGEVPPWPVEGALVDGVGWWADTGTEAGLLVLDQPLVQARVGPAAREVRRLADGAGVTTPSRLQVDADGFAAVSLASVDGLPLTQSHRALLTVGTEQAHDGLVLAWGGALMQSTGTLPATIAPLRGEVRVRWPTRPRATRLLPDGSRGEPLRVRRAGKGWWALRFDATVQTPWILVEDADAG